MKAYTLPQILLVDTCSKNVSWGNNTTWNTHKHCKTRQMYIFQTTWRISTDGRWRSLPTCTSCSPLPNYSWESPVPPRAGLKKAFAGKPLVTDATNPFSWWKSLLDLSLHNHKFQCHGYFIFVCPWILNFLQHSNKSQGNGPLFFVFD